MDAITIHPIELNEYSAFSKPFNPMSEYLGEAMCAAFSPSDVGSKYLISVYNNNDTLSRTVTVKSAVPGSYGEPSITLPPLQHSLISVDLQYFKQTDGKVYIVGDGEDIKCGIFKVP